MHHRLGGTEGEEDVKVARIRLKAARAFLDFMLKAYDALLHHGINYRTLPEYKDEALLDKAEGQRIERGYDSFVEWIRRVGHGLDAAIRRKQFKVFTHINPKEHDDNGRTDE